QHREEGGPAPGGRRVALVAAAALDVADVDERAGHASEIEPRLLAHLAEDGVPRVLGARAPGLAAGGIGVDEAADQRPAPGLGGGVGVAADEEHLGSSGAAAEDGGVHGGVRADVPEGLDGGAEEGVVVEAGQRLGGGAEGPAGVLARLLRAGA